MGISKNSRVGKNIVSNNPTSYALPRYVPGNVGAKWKTQGRYNSKTGVSRLDFRIRRKIGKHTYQYITP